MSSAAHNALNEEGLDCKKSVVLSFCLLQEKAELPTSLIICFKFVEASKIFNWMALYGDIVVSFLLYSQLQMSSAFPKLHNLTLAVPWFNNGISNVIGHCNEDAFVFRQTKG